MTLVKFNPEKKNNSLMPGFNDIFDSVIGDTFFADRRPNSFPAVNISESEEAYLIELAAPGLKKENFKIDLNGDLLNISSAQQSETHNEEKKYNRREFSYSVFSRSFTLPEHADPDAIEANYSEGILKLTLPKKEELRSQIRTIEIK